MRICVSTVEKFYGIYLNIINVKMILMRQEIQIFRDISIERKRHVVSIQNIQKFIYIYINALLITLLSQLT